MHRTDVPFCLKRAREEMLMALGSVDAIDEGVHRRLADKYVAYAVRSIEDEPERQHDWSNLLPDS